ncbi:uncharacterized protein TNCV_4013781 [Trichonephila clavipes]|nr:uncharacterized protein TNCV_4013781 [Trichonephila clavipes]
MSRRSNKRNAGLEDLRLKRKVMSNGTMEKKDRKWSKICKKRCSRGPNIETRKEQHLRQEFNPSQGTVSIAVPSHQQDTRQCNPPTGEIRRGARVQYDKARETRTTHSKGHSANEGRPVRSRQTTTVIPCPYYLRSRIKEPEGIPEEQRNTGIDSLPQNSLRRRSLSVEALDGDQVDRSDYRTKEKSGCIVSFFLLLRTNGRKNYCNEASHGRMFKI